MNHWNAMGLLVPLALVAPAPAIQARPRGASTIEAAAPNLGYDYVVHVRNTPNYKYNPDVRDDRIVMARQIVRPFCPKTQIVGEAVLDTEIFGLITGGLDYVVYVRCLTRLATPQ